MPINTQSHGNTQAHSEIDQRYDGSVTNRHDNHVSMDEMKKYVEGINFPADVHMLIKHAEKQNAPAHVVDLLRQLPTPEFGSPNAKKASTYNSMDELIQEIQRIA